MSQQTIAQFSASFLKTGLPDIRPGDVVRVSQRIKERDKERVQDFEGIVIARKHGKGIGATFTARKIVAGIGVEKTYPLHSPTIEKMEILRRGKVRRAKLYFLREAKGKRARLKFKEFVAPKQIEEPKNQSIEENLPPAEQKTE